MNTTSQEEPRARNLLSHAHSFKLFTWVLSNAATLDGNAAHTAVDMAEDAMGFRVTVANLMSAREATGASFAFAHERPKAKTPEQVLAAELVNLLTKMGEPISPELRKLAGA